MSHLTKYVQEHDQFQLLYPATRLIDGRDLLAWANDCFANGRTEEQATTVEDAIRILEDLGKITLATRLLPPSTIEQADRLDQAQD